MESTELIWKRFRRQVHQHARKMIRAFLAFRLDAKKSSGRIELHFLLVNHVFL